MTGATLPAPIRQRTLPEQLRYFSSRLLNGTVNSTTAALCLQVIADEHEDDQGLRERLEHAEAALARDSDGIRLWMLDCAEVAGLNRQRADKAEAEVQRLRAELDAAPRRQQQEGA